MSDVTGATHRWSGDTVQQTKDGIIGRQVWDVVAPIGSDPLRTGGLPVWNQGHPIYGGIMAGDFAVKPAGLTVWEVTITYSRPADGKAHPLKKDGYLPPTEFWSIGRRMVQSSVDAYGFPVLNSALQPLDHAPFYLPETFLIWRYERSEAAYNPFVAKKYVDRVKAEKFYGQAIGEALCAGIVLAHEERPNASPVRVVYTFEFGTNTTDAAWKDGVKGDAHQWTAVDMGYATRTSDGSVVAVPGGSAFQAPGTRTIVDANGNPSTSPSQLNGRGGLAGSNQGADKPAGALVLHDGDDNSAARLVYRRYQAANFGELHLDQ